jgi:glycosyltransferase involved in cell wall biosynthesis
MTPSRQRIRVVYIDHTAKMSGGEIALLNLLTHLNRERVEPIVILFSDGPLRRKLEQIGIPTEIIPLEDAVLNTRKDMLDGKGLMQVGRAWTSLRHASRLCSRLRAIEPHIVHTNSLKADVIGGLAGRLARCRVVWHIRDRISEDYLPKSSVALIRTLARWLPHHVIGNSVATLDTLRSSQDRSSDQTVLYSGVVIHDGVVLGERPARRRGDIPVVGMVGRLTAWKGQDVLVRAVGLLRDRGVVCQARFVGSAMFGEEEYERSLRLLVAQLGLEDRIEMAGFREDVEAELASMDVLVHASVTPEPFGQVVAEGMAAGKPVIAARAGGVTEIIEDGVSGILTTPGDPVELADAIQRVLGDAEFAHRLASDGRRRIVERFTIQRVARDVEQLYDRLVN